MKLLISGGAGFLGANLALAALTRGHDVTLLDRGDPYGRLAAMKLDGTICRIDADLSRGEWTPDPDIDAIIHLAALAHVDYSRARPRHVIENNVLAISNMVDAATSAGIPLLFASSVEVYGGTQGSILKETDPFHPLSTYAASKVAGEAIIEAARVEKGTCLSIVRLTNLYGPWQAPDRLVPRVATQLLLGTTAEVEEEPVRDFVHVADAAAAVLTVVEDGHWGEVFNVSSGTGTPIATAALSVKQDASPQGQLEIVNSRGDNGRGLFLVSSPERLATQTGWAPKIGLRPGLSRTVEWYDEHREWWQQFSESILSARSTPTFILDYARDVSVN